MSRKKERIDTSGGDGLAADNPFGAISGLNLPAAPNPVPATGGTPVVRSKPRETLLLRRLKAGKGGKVVTEVSGFDANPQVIQDLLKRLQGRLGVGGTCKGKILELQGEVRDRLKPVLESEGYRVKGV
ncbi:MAG TPA: translation initiation factor [Oceanipulchritudo sp.]|nr:translation initiation factor [Oceanipulchritudo sp.]